MKKSIISLVALVVVIVLILVLGKGSTNPAPTTENQANTQPAPAIPVTETTKVSSKTSQYQNSELGFSVNYPTSWEADSTDNGVTFIIPIDQGQVSTVAKLQGDITVSPGKCSFPPVPTVKDRGTLKVGENTLNTISMSNSVQGRAYFNRLYSLQQGGTCYLFVFTSIALSPESKKLTGSNLTQAQNNNKAITNTADSDFTNLVKTFSFVQGPAGVDETKAPAK